ncbi:hypothetical protein [Hwanghaeella sp.]|uniref:hypothetical protein n=1 Tax=Hwanghaeella sp. TaxID=2605943 RepID=UPI003CCBB50D
MKHFLALLFALLPFNLCAQGIVSGAGTYSGGEYQLVADILLEQGDGVVFTGPALLDLHGYKIKTDQTGNAAGYGVRFLAPSSSIKNGQVSGFWAGVRFDGDNSSIENVDISARYMGVQIEGNNVTVRGGSISDISGVTNARYAIGVQVNGENCKILDVEFRNIYAQANYLGKEAGEGVAVNFSSRSKNCILSRGSYRNERYEGATIGVFAAGEGGHLIDQFEMVNIFEPLQIARTNPPTRVINTVVRYAINAQY